MSSESVRDAFRSFTTTCALITVNGPRGPNVMAAEWTFNVSYRPFLIAVHIDQANVTHDEILAAGEFGVNLVSDEQGAAMRFAGHFSKAETDKLSSEVFDMYPAERIGAPLIRGALLNAECRLVQHFPLGDHTAFIGEVLAFTADPGKSPLILHRGSHRLGEKIARPPAMVVAATPDAVAPGGQVTVHAELPGTATQRVKLLLAGPDHQERDLDEVDPAGQDSFETRLTVPADLPPGSYRLVVRAGGIEGRARLQVSPS